MKKICGIYAIKNVITGKMYIGKSVDILTRWRGHINALRRQGHHSQYLQRSWNKYGPESFIFGIIEVYTKDLLDVKEKYWIEYYNTYNEGYNEYLPNGDNNGRIWSDEEKLQASVRAKAQWSKLTKKEKMLRIKNLTENDYCKEDDTNVNIRFYNKNTQELENTFNSFKEAADFLKVNKKTILKNIEKINNIEDRHNTYKGYIILKRDYTLAKYNNMLHIRKLNKDLDKVKRELEKERNMKPLLTKEEKKAIWVKNLEGCIKLKPVIMINTATNEIVGKYPGVVPMCKEYDFNPKFIYRVISGEKKSYKGFTFKYL